MSDINAQFRSQLAALVDWVEAYAGRINGLPVRAQTTPGDILGQLAEAAPEAAHPVEDVLHGLDTFLPGITHWQHPRFFAYFPANVRPESLLADAVLAAFGTNAMLWETSPAATELEIRTTDWLKQAMGLPSDWRGVIQDTASSATFAAVVTARERAAQGKSNRHGLRDCPPMALYVSAEAHSSVEKAARMAGLGSAALRVIETRPDRSMDPAALDKAMARDVAAGVIPAALMVTAGGTGTGAFDCATEVIPIAKRYGAYVHVDAAWAGPAMLVERFRPLFAGVEAADSFVFNPHKWMGIGFDCSIQFLKTPQTQIDALTVKPTYLESRDGVTDFSDWSPVLGRRNRGLKIWIVLMLVGLGRIRSDIEAHVDWTARLAKRVSEAPGFHVVTPPSLALFTFRYKDDDRTLALLEAVNADGRTYLTKTLVEGRPVIRWSVGVWRTREDDLHRAFDAVEEIAGRLA